MYEAMGLCEEGEGAKLLRNSDWLTNSRGKITNCVPVPDRMPGIFCGLFMPQFHQTVND